VRARVLGVLLLVAVVGVGGGLVAGWGVGQLGQSQAAAGGTASPLPASSPSVPVDPPPTVAPYADDIDYPPLQPGLTLARQPMGNSVQAWVVPYPKGWQAFTVPGEVEVPRKERSTYDELRFRPPDEPIQGGYSLRVKTVNDHVTPATMVAERIRLVTKAYGADDVDYSRTEDSVRFVFRDGNNRLRYNYFQWFAGPDSSEASLEMSVAGRTADEPGLDALFATFASSLQPAHE
jgi:hypothetical protein